VAARNSVRVTVDEHWRQWGDSALSGIMHRLDAVMPAAAEAAAKLEVPEESGNLKGSIRANVAEREGDKIEASISAGDYKANWYENGTGARRSKRIKHARTRSSASRREQKRQDLRASGSTAGVKALHFLRKGLYAARVVVFHEIGEAMRQARGL
jgi:hypothetical protein